MAHHFLSSTFTPAVLREQAAYYGRAQQVPPAPGPDELGAQEEVFIQRRDSFYLASVNADGWPYIQHRGGPRGFLKLIDSQTLGFADLSGNDRVALFLMNYARRERLKILGHARVIPAEDDAALVSELAPEGVPVRLVERVITIRVTGYDWNCPKYITPRFTAEEVEKAAAPLRRRIAELESELAARRGSAGSS